jgi:hypothetical protein
MNAPTEGMRLVTSLKERYTAGEGWLYMTGTQALVRLPIQQRMRDAAAGLNTGAYVSGYRGSPLGTLDMALWAAAEQLKQDDIHFLPGINDRRVPDISPLYADLKGLCPALADEVIATLPVAAESFADLTVAAPPQASELTNEQLAAILPAEDMIREFLDAVRTEAVRRAGEGELIPGHKLVQGKKGPRQWAKGEETAIAQYLDETVRLRHDEMYTQKLISPTQVEKLVGPVQYRKLAQYITQSDGALAIAPVSDKRPAVNPVALPEQFEVITQE